MNRFPRPLALVAVFVALVAASSAMAQEVFYRVTFDATWTAETHPQSYPPDAHFSGLVGGTHNGAVSFWDEGQLASLGIKRMAEWGSQGDLLAEVQAAIDAGQAAATITDVPMWTVPGTTSVDFPVTTTHSLVTLVAMIAPSPDWFVGVKGLDLAPGGNFVEQLTVDLYPWDAGTDSGANYTFGDQPTVPPVPVFAITGFPFTPGVPIGTFTFTKLFVSDVPRSAGLRAIAYPNPFNPRATIAWELPRAGRMQLDIFDVRGRRVRTLWDQETAEGPGQTAWDGRDNSGRMARSGMYLYLVRFGEKRLSGSLTLIK